MAYDVSVIPCGSYEASEVREALKKALEPIGGLDWVEPGMKIAVKTNLVAPMRPDSAATTHPAMLKALAEELLARGAQVVIGDSPGGLYSAGYVGKIYSICGLKPIECEGVSLNQDFSEVDVEYPEGKAIHKFTMTGYLREADAIINFCKLKAHGMMGMSAAVKNLFGIIPGTLKPEYHYRFPNEGDFADMLIDLNEFLKVKLNLIDAVVAMEGNGPTMGKPRKVGAILAGKNPYRLDLAAAHLMGIGKENVPTLEAAYSRGLAPATVAEVSIYGDADALQVKDFDNILSLHGIHFEREFGGLLGKVAGWVVRTAMSSRPEVKDGCIRCGVCANTCPAKAIEIRELPVIDRKKCIRCFCCQEFCPKGAMVVKRPLIARVLHRRQEGKR